MDKDNKEESDPPTSRSDDEPTSPTLASRQTTNRIQFVDYGAEGANFRRHRTGTADTAVDDEGPVQNTVSTDSMDGGFHHIRRWWKFKMRGFDDDMDRDWWFASTAIPLLSATIAPLANVLSICALVTYWRMNIDDGQGGILTEQMGTTFPDPRWCYWLNVGSLICGFVGNVFLLFNFTGRVRYIIALPATIIFFFVAAGILVAITACMKIYFAPVAPYEVFTQGYWYAVIAAVFYFFIGMLLMVNMLGYFLGHYPQQFDLTDSQRTLILQTMMFFIWLAGGGAVFADVEKKYGDNDQAWSYANSIYFCDVTILTVGFGDMYPTTNLGRGLVFPYSVGGIIFLGLVITSISHFVTEISEDKVIKKHVERTRHKTVSRAISEPDEISRIESRHDAVFTNGGRHVKISAPTNPTKLGRIGNTLGLSVYNRRDREKMAVRERRRSSTSIIPHPVRRRTKLFDAAAYHTKRHVILRDEKDRFEAMRSIQSQTHRFKRYYALCMSVTSFSILWVVGAVVFWQCEKDVQGLTYFEALYFCYVSLLTIGYGDLAPKSNGGRCFFVVWSLIAVPTMTILINDLGGTLIKSFKEGTFRFADFTLLPKKGAYREWLEAHPKIFGYLQRRKEKKESEKRLKEGMKFPGEPGGESMDPDAEAVEAGLHPSFETLSQEVKDEEARKQLETHEQLARRLAIAIRSVASDLKVCNTKKYTFEEWASITQLIRFTSFGEDAAVEALEDHGIVEWDWLGENSPMMGGQTEPEFVLDRLCESLGRYMRRVERVKGRLRLGADGVFAREEKEFDDLMEEREQTSNEGEGSLPVSPTDDGIVQHEKI